MNEGERAAGKKLFESVGCVRCHVTPTGKQSLAPDLKTVSKRFRGLKLLQQILEPSAEIHKDFQTWSALLNNGKVVSGLLRQRDDIIRIQPNPLVETTIDLASADVERSFSIEEVHNA